MKETQNTDVQVLDFYNPPARPLTKFQSGCEVTGDRLYCVISRSLPGTVFCAACRSSFQWTIDEPGRNPEKNKTARHFGLPAAIMSFTDL